jgi:asparagine synthase (glutamine-hydrolysing)
MCGLCGFILDGSSSDQQQFIKIINVMTERLSHRGPDELGIWSDPDAGVYLGHRRLSIIDLSSRGRQPMISNCGNYVITYNGEVFNYKELRIQLLQEGYSFTGGSDTEVVLAACVVWGVRNAIERLIGMFAFSLLDRRERRLSLVRDRIGIKPLYWHFTSGRIAFASELKALRAMPDWKPEVDRHALASYLRHAYVPTPATIYSGVSKLPPGSILTWMPGQSPEIEQYWNPLSQNDLSNHSMSDDEAIDTLDTLLGDAIKRRMISDVPLGAMLSGGVDSSVVTALMQKHSERPIKTFSIGFNESGYNEAGYASQVARHLGTEHSELYVEPKHALDIIPRLPEIYDEPFADASQIPTFLISELLRKHVTVALSGDGGDELFAGYTRYQWAGKFAYIAKLLPASLRNYFTNVINKYSPQQWNNVLNRLPQNMRPSHAGDKLYKIASILPLTNEQDIYCRLVSQWPDPAYIMDNANEMKTALSNEYLNTLIPDYISRMQYLDLVTYLPDDILVKVDRASMAVGLEARVPLLDHRIVEFAWAQPLNRKMRSGRGKWLLRQVLYRYVPASIVDRPKMGFGVPIDKWLRGPLKEWAQDLLSAERLRDDGLFTVSNVQKCLQEHMSGHRNHQNRLWVLLMYQAWQDRWLKNGI